MMIDFSDLEEFSLDDWVVRAQKGEQEAKIYIIKKIHPLLYKMMLYVPREYRDVEELYQESVLRVLELIQSYEPGRGVPFIGYVQTMLRFWYLSKRQETKELPVDWDVLQSFIGTVEGTQDEEILVKEQREWLVKGFNQLTKRQRIAVWRYYIEGVSLGKIAKELGCSYGVAVKHKKKGLENLRKILPKDLI